MDNGRAPFKPTPTVTAPEPITWALYLHVDRQSSHVVRRILDYDENDDIIFVEDGELEEGELVEAEKEKEEEEKQVKQEEDIRAILPIASVLMAVRAISSILHQSVVEHCEGCVEERGCQLDHQECLFLPWEDKLDNYFEQAVARLNCGVFLTFFDTVYKLDEMFIPEQDCVVGEATEFFEIDMKEARVLELIKQTILKG